MSLPRIDILGIASSKQISQSEEHLVVDGLENLEIGQVVYAVPIHICPTVSKYKKVLVVSKNIIVDSWDILARDHQLKI